MTQHTELIERLSGFGFAITNEAADALEAQAREIAELKAQESELCTLYGLAQAECQKLRKDAALVAARERERCAKVCEGFKTGNSATYIDDDWADMCAAAIRALNTEGDVNDRS